MLGSLVEVLDSPDALLLPFVALLSFAVTYVATSLGLVLVQWRLPLLGVVLGSPLAGVATSLAITTLGAVVGTVMHVRAGRVDLRLVLALGGPSVLAVLFAAQVVESIDPHPGTSAQGLLLVLCAVFVWRGWPWAASTARFGVR